MIAPLLALALWGAAPPAPGPAPRVALRWVEVPGAAAYDLEIARDPAFRDVVVRERVPLAGFRWAELPHAAHHWRVRSIDAEGRTGDWSKAERIAPQVFPPEPQSPAAGATVLLGEEAAEVDLVAQPHALLAGYVFELAPDPAFGRDVQTLRSDAPRVRATVGAPGTWHWRAHAVDVTGRATAPAPARAFEARLHPPEPLEPASGAAVPGGGALGFRWRPHPRAQGYLLERRLEQGAAATTPVRGAGLEVPAGEPGTWHWRVASVDAQGRPGPFGAPRTFRVVPPPAQVVRPRDGERLRAARAGADAPGAAIALEWTLPEGAARARVQVARGEGFEAPLLDAKVEGTSAPLPLPEPGRYAVRVFALDARGRPGPPSAVSWFRVALPGLLPAPGWAASGPAPDAVLPSGEPVALAWTAHEEAEAWELSADGGAPVRADAPGIALPLPDGEHELRVRALDPDGEAGAWSDPARFHVGAPDAVRAEWQLERPELVADGRDAAWVTVRLFDARDRPVPAPHARVWASAGAVREQHLEAGGVRARFVAPLGVPEDGEAELYVEHGSAILRTRVAVRPRGDNLVLGARVGLAHNGGAFAAPHAGVEVFWRAPALDRRLLLSARAGAHGGTTPVGAPELAQPVHVRTQVVPLAAVAAYQLPLGSAALHAGAGPSLTFVQTRADDQRELSARLGVLAVLGASHALGPGRATAELGYGFARARGELAAGAVGGWLATLGYGVTP